jgi:prephenate dehydratase
MIKIGFLGPSGSFSEQATIQFKEIYTSYFSLSEELTFYPQNSITDSLLCVSEKSLDMCIVPIENLVEGAVNSTLDVLADKDNLFINCDFPVKISECLLAKNKSKNNIKNIFSHPQGIGQCARYIAKNFSDSTITFTNSTSEAANLASKSEDGIAAIASKLCAEKYNLEILESDIQDVKNNFTRFVCVSRDINLNNNFNNNKENFIFKSSIVFSTENNPGCLYKILSIFDIWNINLTKIESRPSKTSLGEYIFFADCEHDFCSKDLEDALKMVQRKTSFFRSLGCFPSFKTDSI